jgi:hypothetical protein
VIGENTVTVRNVVTMFRNDVTGYGVMAMCAISGAILRTFMLLVARCGDRSSVGFVGLPRSLWELPMSFKASSLPRSNEVLIHEITSVVGLCLGPIAAASAAVGGVGLWCFVVVGQFCEPTGYGCDWPPIGDAGSQFFLAVSRFKCHGDSACGRLMATGVFMWRIKVWVEQGRWQVLIVVELERGEPDRALGQWGQPQVVRDQPLARDPESGQNPGCREPGPQAVVGGALVQRVRAQRASASVRVDCQRAWVLGCQCVRSIGYCCGVRWRSDRAQDYLPPPHWNHCYRNRNWLNCWGPHYRYSHYQY